MHTDQSANNPQTDENLHLAKLTYYDIVDTPAEQAFDQLAQLAAMAFDVSSAGICFGDQDQLFVKSKIGQTVFPSNLNETGFLATAPILSPEGYEIGFVYVAGEKGKELTDKQLETLKLFAAMVTEKLESRIAIRRTFRAYDDRLHVLVHDLKNPMTTILLQSELMGRIPGIDEKAILIAGKVNAQSKRMIDNLNGLLSGARKEAHSFKPKKEQVDLKAIITQAKSDLHVKIEQKKQSVNIDIQNPLEIFGDQEKLKVAFNLLIDNALKFSPAEKEINISGKTDGNEITIAIKDIGVGLTADDLDRIFLKFPRLSVVATAQENNYGLGLITANAIIDVHKGRLWAESEGKNLGTTFFVSLPIK